MVINILYRIIISLKVQTRGGDYRGDGGHVPPTFWLGVRGKGKCPPLIAHLVKFLGHIFHLDNWITALVECRCIVFHIYNSEMLILNIRASVSLAVRGGDYRGNGETRPPTFFGGDNILAPPPDPHHSEEIAATGSNICIATKAIKYMVFNSFDSTLTINHIFFANRVVLFSVYVLVRIKRFLFTGLCLFLAMY